MQIGWAGWTPAPSFVPRAHAAGSFLSHTYRGQAGSRGYKLYVPAGRAQAPLPLVVMLHGCFQTADDFAAGTRMNLLADRHGFLVAYPTQSHGANSHRCWNWFEPGDQVRDAGEPSLIAGITREALARRGADLRRVYVAGMSAGGAMAVILGRNYPDLYAAVGVHSGLPYGAAHDLRSAMAAMRRGAPAAAAARAVAARAAVPTIVFHGDRDYLVNVRNGAELMRQTRELHAAGRGSRAALGPLSRHEGRSDDGVPYTRTLQADAAGRPVLEQWVLHGAGHAWSGGSAEGSHTSARGPDASAQMLRFFACHALDTAQPAPGRQAA